MQKRNGGFTMVEMLTVTGIIAILAISALFIVRSSVPRARDERRYKDLDNIEAALFSFYAQNGQFPSTGRVWWSICTGQNDWIPGLAPTFISSLPQDPQRCLNNPGIYDGYIYISDGNDFKVATDWMAEQGDLCNNQGDKYFDTARGPGQAQWHPEFGKFFCSLSTPGAAGW